MGAAGTLAAAAPWLLPVGYAQTRGPARAFLRGVPGRADFDRRLLGSFLEHLGRAVYTGVYRLVLALRRCQGIPHRRRARGQGAGRADRPVSRRQFRLRLQLARRRRAEGQRPTVLERAWNSIETNQFGTNEFIEWCAMVGAEPLLGMNFGTGSVEMAVAYVEYCNLARGTRWSELRRTARLRAAAQRPLLVSRQRDGRAVADRPAAGARVRAQGARRRQADAGHRSRPAAHRLRIERHVHADVSHLGPRSPRGMLRPGGRPLASRLLRQHEGVVGQQHRAVPRDEPRHGSPHPRDLRRSATMCRGCRSRSKRLWLSFDEWNVWYRARDAKATDGKRAAAPPLLEEVYNLEDALLVGGFINTLLRNSDRVRVGCLAQLVNVIAPLVTNDTRRAASEHLLSLQLGAALRARARARRARRVGDLPDQGGGPAGGFRARGDVPFVDLIATVDDAAHQAAVLVLNRDLEGEREVVLEWEDVVPTRVPDLRDADRRRSQGGQHVRQSRSRPAAEARRHPGQADA